MNSRKTTVQSCTHQLSVCVRCGTVCLVFIVHCMFALMLTRIHPNLKTTVYCSAIAFGGVKEWDFAWRMFKNATLASEASRLRSAMACTKAPWLLNRYMQHSDFVGVSSFKVFCECDYHLFINYLFFNVQHCNSFVFCTFKDTNLVDKNYIH